MDEIKQSITLDDSGFGEATDRIINDLHSIGDASEETAEQFEEWMKTFSKSLSESEKETRKLNLAIAKLQAGNLALVEEQNRYEKSIKRSLGFLKIFGVDVDKLATRLTSLRVRIKDKVVALGEMSDKVEESTGYINEFGQRWGDFLNILSTRFPKAAKAVVAGLRLIKVALIATGIGALIVLVGALIAGLVNLSNTLSGVNKELSNTERASIAWAAAVQTAGGIVSNFVKGLKDAFNGVKSLGDVFRGTAKEINQFAATVGIAALSLAEAEKAAKAAEIAQNNLADSIANSKDALNQQREAAADGNKAIGSRVSAIRQAAAIEGNLEKQRLEILQLNVKEEKARLEAAKVTGKGIEDAQKRVNDASRELQLTQAEVNARQRADQNAINNLFREQRELVKSLRADYQGFLNELENRFNDARLTNLLPEPDQLKLERDLALAEVDEFVAQVIEAREKLLKAGGKDILPADFDQQVAALQLSIEVAYSDARQAVAEENKKAAKKFFTDQIEIVRVGVGEFAPQLRRFLPTIIEQEALDKQRKTFKDWAESFKNPDLRGPFEKLKEDILLALDINEAELDFVLQAVGGALSNFAKASETFTQIQIEQNQRIIDSLTRRIDETKALLDKELKDKEAGYANDYDLYKNQLQLLTEERDRVNNENLEKQKKLANAQLAINAAQQVSEYVLAAATLFRKGSEFGPIVGVALALGAIGILASTIATARANAERFREVEQFHEGGPVEGALHGFGGKKIEVEGREFVVKGDVAQRHGDFLEALNAGRFQQIDLQKLLLGGGANLEPTLKKMGKDRDVIVNLTSGIDYSLMEQMYSRATDKMADKVIGYLQTRPVELLDSEGNAVRQWKEGNNIRRQRVNVKKQQADA